MPKREIKRALISVYDKTGIVEFAKALSTEFGIEIISTGGTAKLLKENDIPVTLVEEVTGFPEMMDGRVKTLHPKIHAGILADRDNPEHMRQLKEQGIKPIDMVVVNLYPFEKTVADPTCTLEQAIEMIDIGGPCMLRAAAKNHRHVIPIAHIRSYEFVLEALSENGDLDQTGRSCLASIIFETTSDYDDHVEHYLCKHWGKLRDEIYEGMRERFEGMRKRFPFPTMDSETTDSFPGMSRLILADLLTMRYGENPHQQARLTGWIDSPTQGSNLVDNDLSENSGLNISFNNFADGHAALELCKELTRGLCRTGFQPVNPRDTGSQSEHQFNLERLSDEKHTRRKLPHIQTPGKTYLVTFRLKGKRTLSPGERSLVLEACRFWDGEKVNLHAVVIMRDHVHLLLTPLELKTGQWVSLSEVLHSIKRHSAKLINESRGRSGAIWQHESFDRIIRNNEEFQNKIDYIANNPLKEELDENGYYPWWWDEQIHANEEVDRLETGPTLRTSCCVFIKHTNACGSSTDLDPVKAYRKAYLGDPNAAMGGILACNFEIDHDFATTVMETYDRFGKEAGAGGFFIEVWIAPSFDKEALKIIREAKKWGRRLRLLGVGDMDVTPDERDLEYKSITGGMLVQTRDMVGLNEDQWKVVTKSTPTDQELNDLRLAWLVCKHTKSNAISLCRDNMLIGNGAGQMSRVMSCRIATWLAKENGHKDKLKGSVAASDAFFPFRDGPDILMEAGVSAIIQPGGSKRDADTIKACNERSVSMIHTGTRHFKH